MPRASLIFPWKTSRRRSNRAEPKDAKPCPLKTVLFEPLHTHVLTLERLLAEDPTLPLAEIIKDIKATAGFILETVP